MEEFEDESDEDMARSVVNQRAKVSIGTIFSPKKGKDKGVMIKKPMSASEGKRRGKRHKAPRDQVPILKLPGLPKSLEYLLKELVLVGNPPYLKGKERYP